MQLPLQQSNRQQDFACKVVASMHVVVFFPATYLYLDAVNERNFLFLLPSVEFPEIQGGFRLLRRCSSQIMAGKNVFVAMLRLLPFYLRMAGVIAQQFPDYAISNQWPGITTKCATALNTTVDCSGILGIVAEELAIHDASLPMTIID